MRNTLAGVLVVAATCFLIQQPLSAATIAIDDFESYSLSTIIGQGTAADGWTEAWGGDASSGMPTADIVAGAIAGYGQSLELGLSAPGTGTQRRNNNMAVRSFTPQTGTVYIGFVVQTSGWDTGDVFQLYANNSTSSSLNSSFSGGINAADYLIRKGGSANNSNAASPAHANGTTNRLVIRFSKSTGLDGDNYDELALFVDQMAEGVPNVFRDSTTTDNAALGTTISALHLRMADPEIGDWLHLDDLRIATTYAEAVPEPTGVVLMLLGGASLPYVFLRSRKGRCMRQPRANS